MIESSRLFLWTEYARKDCGVIETHGTNYKVWDNLPVRFPFPPSPLPLPPRFLAFGMLSNPQDRFSSNKRAQDLLARIKQDKVAEKQRLASYYFGGFAHGANTRDDDGVHREEFEEYLGVGKVNGVKA